MSPPSPTLGFAVNSEGSLLAALAVPDVWGAGAARAPAAKRAAVAYLWDIVRWLILDVVDDEGDIQEIDIYHKKGNEPRRPYYCVE